MFRPWLLLVGVVVACSAPPPDEPPDAQTPEPDAGAPVDAGTPDAGLADAGAYDGGGRDAGPLPDAGPCRSGESAQVAACLAADGGPDACLARLGPSPRCDADGDGLADDLEEALAVAYLPVFAFNSGAHGGNPETDWPANLRHFVSHAHLVFRQGSSVTVNAAPTLASLEKAVFGVGSTALFANDPEGGGPDFWLCLTDTSPATRVQSRDAMLALPHGVSLITVAHPANGELAASSHLFVSFGLFFAYNRHSTIDNHEGDFESVALFIDRDSGAVDAVWFDRHASTDGTQFVDVATYGAKDPSAEQPHGNVSSSVPALHGLRFWDYSGHRRHVVAYVATGGHALYDYPANTYITPLLVRDTHNGDGDKLFGGALYPEFGGVPNARLDGGMVRENPGEVSHITAAWARYRGQWGCDDGLVGKSWPVPFGNARHARPLFERLWGSPPGP